MALHALWDDQYAFSVRKGPIDWTDKTTGSTDGNTTDAVSHTDAGVSTQHATADSPAIQLGGSAHFSATRGAAAITTGTGSAAAGVLSKGRHIGIPTSGTAVIHGIPVSGNPDFSVGTEIIETAVADGTVVGRVGGGSVTNDGSSIFRGGSSPTFSMECVPTNMQLMLLGATFFQEGTSQGLAAGSDKGKMQLRTVADDQVSDPLYVGSFLKKMSAEDTDSRVLSDCCPSSFSLSADRSTPLTLGMDFTGRILVTDYDAGDKAVTTADNTTPADTTLDIGRNYAMHDCIATISEGTSTTQYVMPVDSFSLNGSMETGYTFYNQPTPQSILTGPQSWEGSITIPLAGRGATGSEKATNQTLTKLMAQVGMTGSIPSGTVNPIHISLFWEAQSPISAAFGVNATLPNTRSEASKVANDRDLHIRMTCVITDISVGGDAEATQTISFRCLNQMTSATAVAAYAVSIDSKAPASSGTDYQSIFGFTDTTVTY